MESKKVLSFGGGLQTTAMAILVSQGKIVIDEAVFVDTGAEKPETYYYLDSYIKPLFKEMNILFTSLPGTAQGRNLIEHCEHYSVTPTTRMRWCTDKFKVRPILKYIGKKAISLIGFSYDEQNRAERAIHQGKQKSFPLIDLGFTTADCSRLITNYGWPVPLRSSCFFCPYQRWSDWNWLKQRHPELIDKAIGLEAAFHKRKPEYRDTLGLFGGGPLWKWVNGIQMEMPILEEYSCWSGYCSH